MNRYTQEEDRIIVEQIMDNFDNISRGIHNAALLLRRNEKAIRSRWYAKLSKQPDKVAFMSVSVRRSMKNRKIYYPSSKEFTMNHSDTIGKRIINFITRVVKWK